MLGFVCVLVMVFVCFVTLYLQAERHAKQARFDRNAIAAGLYRALTMLSTASYTTQALVRGVDALFISKYGIDMAKAGSAPCAPRGWDSTATPEEENREAQEIAQEVMG